MKEYIKNIIYYFRDFLENDFKKTKAPQRKIDNRVISTKKGVFTVSLKANEYNNLFEDLLLYLKDLIVNGNDAPFQIKSNQYTYKSKNLDLIKKKLKILILKILKLLKI